MSEPLEELKRLRDFMEAIEDDSVTIGDLLIKLDAIIHSLEQREKERAEVVAEMRRVCYVPGVESDNLTVREWKRTGNEWADRLESHNK